MEIYGSAAARKQQLTEHAYDRHLQQMRYRSTAAAEKQMAARGAL